MRRTFYFVCCALLFCCMCGAWAVIIWFEIAAAPDPTLPILLPVLAACCMLLRLDSLVHESGHFLFGLLAGLKPRRVAFGWVSFGEGGVRFGRRSAAGETRFSLKKPQEAHAKLIAATVGGPFLGIVFGVVMLALYFVLPMHPALTFFTFFATWCLAEALMELLPAELPAGKTDGLVLKELIKRTGETEIAVRVMQAQLLLQNRSAGTLPRELLFDVPVVREDSPAFIELLKLQADFLHEHGDGEGEAAVRVRLQAIMDEGEGAPGKTA